MMTCAEYRRWLSPYVDSVLEPERRAELDDHLQDCGSCRQELASLQGMLQTLRTLEPLPAPDLVPGIRRKLDATSWWRRLALRFAAPWPVSLPLHGLALATTALLVVVVANLPGVARRDRLAQERMEVFAKPAEEIPKERASEAKQKQEAGYAGDRLAASAPAAEKLAFRAGELEAESKNRDVEKDQQVILQGSLGQGETYGGVADFDTSNALTSTKEGTEHGKLSRSLTSTNAAGAGRADSPARESLRKQASTPAAPEPSGGALEPIQAQWRVADFAAAASEVSAWVSARQGLAVATNDHHLSIKLPSSAVPDFLQQFTTEPGTPPTGGVGDGSAEGRSPRPTDPPAAPDPTQPLWLTISLELVRAE